MSTARSRGSKRNGGGAAREKRTGRIKGWLDATGKNVLAGVPKGKLAKGTFMTCCDMIDEYKAGRRLIDARAWKTFWDKLDAGFADGLFRRSGHSEDDFAKVPFSVMLMTIADDRARYEEDQETDEEAGEADADAGGSIVFDFGVPAATAISRVDAELKAVDALKADALNRPVHGCGEY